MLLFASACGGAALTPTGRSAPTRQASDTVEAQSTEAATASPSATATTTPRPETPPPTLAPYPVNGNSGPNLQSLINQRRPASFPAPLARGPYDHFYLARPFGAADFDRPAPSTRYGEVRGLGNLIGHTGVDYGMDSGTPILAAADGTVVWSGYGLLTGYENPDDPYGIAVAIRHEIGYEGERLFTVYAHLSEALVTVNQVVKQGEVIGLSGNTGDSTGPHLHFEVRLGENKIQNTRNPELWITPPEGWGVLVGQLYATDGQELKNKLVQVTSLASGRHTVLYSYAAQYNANKDGYYQENLVLSDLPAGRYLIEIPYITIWIRVEVEIKPGAVTFFTFHGYDKYGFELPEVQPPPNVPRVSITK